MNRKRISLLVIALVWAAQGIVSAQGIEFFHGTWAEALEKAKAEKKLIFVDAFASWCGPCKRMAKETFPDQKAGDYFNANFVNLKIDMEKPENADFANKYPVKSYPTLFFIDETGKIVAREIGAKGVDDLIGAAKKVVRKYDRSGEYEQRYNDGDRAPQMIFDYVKALNAAGKPSLKVSNEYLKTQKDLKTDFNLRFIFEAATEADSRIFDLLTEQKALIKPLVGDDLFHSRVESACRNTVKKAIEYKDEALLAQAKSRMKSVHPTKAVAFGYDSDLNYYRATKDVKNYLRAMNGYRKSEGSSATKQHDLVIMLVRAFPQEPKALDQAEEWAEEAAKKGGLPEYYMTLAEIQKRQEKKEAARKSAQKALDIMGESGDPMLKIKIKSFMDGV